MKDRQKLSASISAEALRVPTDAPRRPPQFEITDLLPLENKKSLPKEPLSLPRPGRNPINITTANSPPAASKIFEAQGYAEFLQQAENTELFTYTSALCYRVTGKYLPRTLLQSDPQAQQRELERVQRDPEILRAIDAVRVLSTQFKSVAQDTMGHRRELGHTLFRIEESYLKLFEKLLELSLRLYWEYEQRTEAQRKEDRQAIEHWREQFERKSVECEKAKKKLAAREIVHRTRGMELEDFKGQLREVEMELGSQRELEKQVLQLQDAAAVQRLLQKQVEEDLLQLNKKHEDMIEYHKQQREEMLAQQKEIITGLRKTVREKERFIDKQEVILHQLEEVASVAPPVMESNSSQTEVDDDGLWDIQDGIPRFVSKSMVHKIMWRRFNAFVACKNCGGRPLPKAAKTNPFRTDSYEAGNEEIDVWSIDKGKKISKKTTKRINRIEEQWELPSHTILFLSNLPKSVVAFPFYSLEDVIAQIEAIYDDKFISDKVDEADGVAQEELPRFICEYFLKTHGLRQSAEIGLYRFLISVKNSFHGNSHVRLFARLANLLKSEEEDFEDTETSTPEVTKKQTKTNAVALMDKPEAKKGEHLGHLDRSFLRVFLEARHYLLRSPPQASPKSKKTRAGAAVASQSPQIEHVIQVEPTKKWVPLDHAIRVLRWYINCLAEDVVSEFCRQVEHGTAIYDGRTLTEIAGNRLAVRAEMRRVMLANENLDAGLASQDSQDSKRPPPPRIVADVHKVLLLLMNALEQRRDGIRIDLTALFDAGDENHDCVLSLDEFCAIIRVRKPHFSDRRILRMFREALMGGVDQSFALSMEAFVAVCNDHGLVSLLPDDRMTDPFASIEPASPTLKDSKRKPEIVKQPADIIEDLDTPVEEDDTCSTKEIAE